MPMFPRRRHEIRAPVEKLKRRELDAIVEAARAPYKAVFLPMAETGMRIGKVVHLTHDDLTLDGPTPVAHIRPKVVVPGDRPWRPKNGEQRAVPLSRRAVAMLRDLPRRRQWLIDRMDGTTATTNLPPNDRHILAYLKTVLAKLGLEGANHKFRHFLLHDRRPQRGEILHAPALGRPRRRGGVQN